MPITPSHHSDFEEAEARFRREIPHLLALTEKLGSWVLFSADGLVDEGPEELLLYEKYGKQIGEQYFLGRVQPEVGAAEVTPNWFVIVEETTTSQNPKRPV